MRMCDLTKDTEASVTTSWKRMPTTKTQDLNYVQETSKSSYKSKSKAHGPSEMISRITWDSWNVEN
jgi:hypothetical protein